MSETYHENIEKIEILLRSACFIIRQKGREILQDFDITPPQFNALQFLNEGELTVSELSSKLYLAPSTITDLVDRMEKGNLVTRVRDTQDRRTVKIKIEEKGCSLIYDVIARRCKYLDTIIGEMPEADKEKFIEYLEILNKQPDSF
ncbi:MAG: MarR family winged helix-turn-helix transcriptional regulator [Bacillota bacterium]